VTAKSLIRRAAARQDELDAVAYYAREAGLDVALRFNAALRDAYQAIAAQPRAGSARWGERLRIAGLRSRLVARFPYLVFYVEQETHIEVRRVLHAKRDIPAWLEEGEL
jgi:toxin ParE1/3/4